MASSQSRSQTTILVVEDDPMLRKFYRSALLLAGYRVVTAEDGIEGLQRIEGDQPAAVVLDIELPRLSGRDVGRELAARLRHIPVIVVTGMDRVDLDPEIYVCLLRKPVTATALIEAVDNCLRDAGGSLPHRNSS